MHALYRRLTLFSYMDHHDAASIPPPMKMGISVLRGAYIQYDQHDATHTHTRIHIYHQQANFAIAESNEHR